MKLRNSKREELTINLTPLIDVVFLLLIFFMVSTSFSKNSELVVDLPEADSNPAEKRNNIIDVTIDKEGRFYVNQKLMINTQASTLKQAISKEMRLSKKPALIISADRKTPHEAVVRAMDVARQLNIVNLSIATKTNAASP